MRSKAKDEIIGWRTTDRTCTPIRMARVRCSVEEIELEGDFSEIPSVQVTCSKCNHTAEAYGTHEQSIKRCLVMLRDECQLGENNWYYTEEEEL